MDNYEYTKQAAAWGVQKQRYIKEIGELQREQKDLRGELYKALSRLEDAEHAVDEWEAHAKNVSAERDELQAELDEAESDRDDWKDRAEMADADRVEVLKKNDQLRAKLDGVEQRPEWLGDVPDPDSIEVERGQHGDFYVDGVWSAYGNSTVHGLRKVVADAVELWARREAVARFIEAEEAATRDDEQQVEKQAERLYLSTQGEIAVAWEALTEPMRNGFRAAIRAGWTPPESEDKK